MTNQRNRVSKLLMNLHALQNNRPELIWSQLRFEAICQLEPTCHAVYGYIKGRGERVTTSMDVAAQFELSPKYASTIVKGLYDLGLLTREERRDDIARWFEYRVSS
jgi:hypothetical protein